MADLLPKAGKNTKLSTRRPKYTVHLLLIKCFCGQEKQIMKYFILNNKCLLCDQLLISPRNIGHYQVGMYVLRIARKAS